MPKKSHTSDSGQIEEVGFGRDGLYRVRVRLQSKRKGRRGTLSETIKDRNKQEATRRARNRLKDLLNEKNNPRFLNPNRETLNTAFDRFLRDVKAKEVRPQTLSDYKDNYDRYCRETIGTQPVNKLERIDIQKHIDSLPVGPRTKKKVWTYLKAAFREWIACKYVQFNPCEQVTLPTYKPKKFKVFTPDDFNALVNASPLAWQALFMLAVDSGMRPEEYLALEWSKFSRKILVDRALVRLPKGEYVFDDLKTDGSRRTIPIAPATYDIIHKHRGEQLKHRLKMGAYWTDLDLVFPTEIGTPFTLSNLNRKFRSMMEKAKITGYRPYDLRHTMATWLLEDGENLKVVSERLGHSSIRITADTYAHVSEGMQQSATDRLSKRLSNVSNLCQKVTGVHG